MSLRDFELLQKYGIKTKHVADRMGVSESLLRYHLAHELKYPATAETFRAALLTIADGIRSDLAIVVKIATGPVRKLPKGRASMTVKVKEVKVVNKKRVPAKSKKK